MPDLNSIPLHGSLIVCPRCFTENDKSPAIEQIRSKAKSGKRDKPVLLLAVCIGCNLKLPVVANGDGRVEYVDVNPYRDVADEETRPEDIPSSPAVTSEEAAMSSCQNGDKHFQDENYVQAYVCWRTAHAWFAAQPDGSAMASGLLSNMGMALSRLRCPTYALKCFKEALSGMQKEDEPEAYGTVLNNIGAAYLHLGEMDKAEEYHRQAYELHLANGSEEFLVRRERHNLAFTYGKIASRHLSAGDLDRALQSVRHAVVLYDGLDSSEDGSIFYLMLGNLLSKKANQARCQKDLQAALQLYQQALDYHQRANAHELVLLQDSESLAELSRAAGHIEDAIAAMHKSDDFLERLSKRPPLSLVVFKKRGSITMFLRRLVNRVGSLFRWKSAGMEGEDHEA